MSAELNFVIWLTFALSVALLLASVGMMLPWKKRP